MWDYLVFFMFFWSDGFLWIFVDMEFFEKGGGREPGKGRMDGRMEGWMGGRKDGRMDRWVGTSEK